MLKRGGRLLRFKASYAIVLIMDAAMPICQIEVALDSFAGRRWVRVELMGETHLYYRVRMLADTKWTGRSRYLAKGRVVLVPKDVSIRRPVVNDDGDFEFDEFGGQHYV